MLINLQGHLSPKVRLTSMRVRFVEFAIRKPGTRCFAAFGWMQSPSASRNALRMVSIPQRLQRELSVPHFKSLSFSIKDFAILTMFDCAFCATQIAEQPFRSFVVPSCRCSCGGTSSFSRYLGAIGVQERATGLVERISSRSVRRRGVMQRYSSFLGTQSDCSQPFY